MRRLSCAVLGLLAAATAYAQYCDFTTSNAGMFVIAVAPPTTPGIDPADHLPIPSGFGDAFYTPPLPSATSTVKNNVDRPVAEPEKPAVVEPWQYRYNVEVDKLRDTKGCPLRVVSRTDRVCFGAKNNQIDLEMVEMVWPRRTFWLCFKIDPDEPRTRPFEKIHANDRVRIINGWPFPIAKVWVRGNRFGCQPSRRRIVLPNDWQEHDPLIPLD